MADYMTTEEKYRQMAQDMYDCLKTITPEKNCSCHISPPCGNCVDFGLQRELMEQFELLEKEGAK